MADANLIAAVARGLRPPQIVGAVANARAEVAQLIARKQIADERIVAILMAAGEIQSPNNIDLFI